MRDFGGRVVAITGAGSGIGRALAHELARRGAHLALSDVDEEGLAETVLTCERSPVRVTPTTVDVADRDAVFSWADDVVERHGKVDVIVNNAGVGLGATVEAQSIGDVEWLMGIDFWGVVHGTQAFLPHLRANGEGHVVNISSVFGLISIPGQSAYNAAKFAVRGYTDALRMELEIADEGISSTTIHPGGVRTNIARNARMDETMALVGAGPDAAADLFDRLARTSPEAAAREILRSVERNRRRAVVGPDGLLLDLVSRLPAGVHQRLLIADARRAATTHPRPDPISAT
ncbi:SDR family NAD(P)-dependent oxidoreductase [Ilumatobacter sp.]|uniref:SDR family NAD(P)-dependent oxidoreductase n=1 Tax=Ilumatobacter sp. TaxID=1967498 RepID=UPI003B52E19A